MSRIGLMLQERENMQNTENFTHCHGIDGICTDRISQGLQYRWHPKWECEKDTAWAQVIQSWRRGGGGE